MKKSMVDYINRMSEDDIDTFENIIIHQYKKFVRFYKLVNSFSEDIEDIYYTFNSPEELEVVLSFTKKSDVDKFKKSINKRIMENGYNGEVKQDGKSLYVKLILNEDEE